MSEEPREDDSRGSFLGAVPPMSDGLEDIAPIQRPPSRHAAEWGFASLFMAAFLGVVAMLTLQINATLFFGPPQWAREDLRNIFFASLASVLLVLALNVVSSVFGIISLLSAVRHGQPCALGLAGLLTSIFALLVWIFAFIDLFAVLDFLMRRQGHGGFF